MMLFASDPQTNLVASRVAEGALRRAIHRMHATALRFPMGSQQRRIMREAADAIADTLSDWRCERERLCEHTGLPIEQSDATVAEDPRA